jgi:hypothetical protein
MVASERKAARTTYRERPVSEILLTGRRHDVFLMAIRGPRGTVLALSIPTVNARRDTAFGTARGRLWAATLTAGKRFEPVWGGGDGHG